MQKARIWRWVLPLFGLLAALGVLVYLVPGGPKDWLAFFMNEDMRPSLFIILMVVLPICGFPIMPFLVLVGIKFGPYWGAGITAMIFAVHLAMSYLLTHSFLRQQVSKLLSRLNYDIPEIRESRRLVFSAIFMILPGLPYTVKNFTLAILNIPFAIYFPVGLLCNFVLAVPFIGLGHTLMADKSLALLFIAFLCCGYWLSLRLKRKWTENNN